MIEFLRGIVLERRSGHVVLEAGGVGYGLTVPEGAAERLGEPGSEAALWVRTYVREDTLRLYGFLTRAERDVFDVFLALPGVGPGIGLAVLSRLTIGEIVRAAASGDAERFRRVRGIGPKLAEKLVLELKSQTERLAAMLPPEEAAGPPAAAAALPTDAARDAAAALEALGVRPALAQRAVARALEALGPQADTAALVREGLKHRRGE